MAHKEQLRIQKHEWLGCLRLGCSQKLTQSLRKGCFVKSSCWWLWQCPPWCPVGFDTWIPAGWGECTVWAAILAEMFNGNWYDLDTGWTKTIGFVPFVVTKCCGSGLWNCHLCMRTALMSTSWKETPHFQYSMKLVQSLWNENTVINIRKCNSALL